MKRKKRHARKATESIVVGLAWYDAAEWAKLKQIAADADLLDDSHEAWLRGAEEAERRMRSRGFVIRRVPIAMDSLVKWCQLRGKLVDGNARTEFVVDKLRRGDSPQA